MIGATAIYLTPRTCCRAFWCCWHCTPSSCSSATYTSAATVGGGKLHELACSFRFFFIQDNEDEEGHTFGKTASDINKCGKITTVESFWAYYSNMLKPSELPSNFDVCFFKDGYQPLCEDKANIGGGKWTARLRKGQVLSLIPKP